MRRAREGFRGLNKRLHRLFEVSRVLPLACAPGQQNPQSKNPFEARPFYRTCRQSRNQLNGLAPLNNPCAEAKKRHHAHWNYFRTTPRYPRPPAGVLRHHIPSSHCICCPLRIIAPHRAAPLRMRRARAGFEHAARHSRSMPRLPHGDANGNAAQTGGIGAASTAKDEPARQARAPRALLLLF